MNQTFQPLALGLGLVVGMHLGPIWAGIFVVVWVADIIVDAISAGGGDDPVG